MGPNISENFPKYRTSMWKFSHETGSHTVLSVAVRGPAAQNRLAVKRARS